MAKSHKDFSHDSVSSRSPSEFNDPRTSSEVVFEDGRIAHVIDEQETGVGMIIGDVSGFHEGQELCLEFRGKQVHAVISAITRFGGRRYRLGVRWAERR